MFERNEQVHERNGQGGAEIEPTKRFYDARLSDNTFSNQSQHPPPFECHCECFVGITSAACKMGSMLIFTFQLL